MKFDIEFAAKSFDFASNLEFNSSEIDQQNINRLASDPNKMLY